MLIERKVDVPAEDLTDEEIEWLNRDNLIKAIKELRYKVNHAHDYTH